MTKDRIAAYFSAMHPIEILTRLAFVGVAAILLGAAAWITVDNLYVISTYENAVAEVTECARIGPVATKGLNYYSVRMRYERDGRSKTTMLDRSNTKYEDGEVISIYYKPETANMAIAGDFSGMWFFVIVLGATGSILLFFGLRPARTR